MEGGSQLEEGRTDNYGEASYEDGPSGCAGGVGRGRYWLDVSGYISKYLTLIRLFHCGSLCISA